MKAQKFFWIINFAFVLSVTGVYGLDSEEKITYNHAAKKVFNKLYNINYHRHSKLIVHPDGASIEDDILCFKDCEVSVW